MWEAFDVSVLKIDMLCDALSVPSMMSHIKTLYYKPLLRY